MELLNRTLRQLLTIQMQKFPEDTWDDHLAPLMLAYRSSIHDSVNFTPHYLMFGREVRLPVDIMFGGETALGESPAEFVSSLRSRLNGAYEIAREYWKGAQKRQKDHYDRKVTGGRYKPGDMVWLYCPAISPGRAKKFHSAWKGPYKVLKAISDVVYRIQHVSQSSDRRRRHRLVVHFNRLKPCYSLSSESSSDSHSPSLPDPPADSPVEEDLMVPLPSDDSLLEPADPNADAAPEDTSSDTEPAPQVDNRGGTHWGGRLRHAIRPTDFYRPSSSS